MPKIAGWPISVTYFAALSKCMGPNMVSAETAASIELSSKAGRTSANVIGFGVAPSRFIATLSNCEAKMRTFLPLKSARCRIGALAMIEDGVDINSAAPCSPLSAPSASISRRTAGSAARRWPCAIEVDQAGRRQHLETLIDADQKLRCDDLALDGAELHAFGLALDRAQLARRIDFDLDAADGILLDRGGVVLGVLMQNVVERRQRDLHHDGLVVGGARAGRQAQHNGDGGGDGRRCPCRIPTSHEHHIDPQSSPTCYRRLRLSSAPQCERRSFQL